MEVLYPRCAGLDVHKDSVVAGVRLATGGPAKTEVRRFDTTTPGLLALSAWLTESGCTRVAMEATGVYWKPVWHTLADGDLTLILANAAHVKNVPGRKTDVADATWLAELLAHGLVRPSFVPEAPTQEVRALLRTRKQLVREQASHVQRLQKTLEDANLKLSSGLTQIMGVSGRAILQALIAGERDPDKLLALVQRGVKAPPERLRAALQGRVTERHRFLLRRHLRQADALGTAIAEIDREVDRDLAPFRQAVRLLRSIPGVSDLTAQVIVSEIGTDMGRFPTAGHLISWAGLCPRNDESAGKRRSTRLRKGAPWLKTTLVPCAWAELTKVPAAQRLEGQRRRPATRGTAISAPSSSACATGAAPRRRSAPSPPPFSPPPTTCCATAPSTRTSAPTTSAAPPPRIRPTASSARSPSSDSPAPLPRSKGMRFLFSPASIMQGEQRAPDP
jgi:transposase